jgi:SAM-dependent methyltransferase
MNYWDKLMTDDENAAGYMLNYGEGPGSPLRHFIGNLINDGESVLDVGCGPGWNLDHFIKYGPAIRAYRGLDYSERFVRVANERWSRGVWYKSIQPENIDYWTYPIFRLGDCRKLKEPDNSWDVVILQDVLEHTNGYKKPIHEALRVARRRVIVTFWHLTEDDDHININPEENDLDGWGAWYSRPKWENFLDALEVNWLHDELPRKGEDTKWDVYIIDKEQTC